MLVLASQILKLPVVAHDVSERVGRVHDLFIDADKGELLGLAISPDWLSKPKLIVADDIRDIDQSGVIIKNHRNIVEIDDVVKIKKIRDDKFRVIGLKVITQSGKRLGKVSDLVISLQTNKIVKFYVKSWLADRIISWQKVVKISRKAVVVEDDVERLPTAVATAVG